MDRVAMGDDRGISSWGTGDAGGAVGVAGLNNSIAGLKVQSGSRADGLVSYFNRNVLRAGRRQRKTKEQDCDFHESLLAKPPL
jgi:hypothetical protein